MLIEELPIEAVSKAYFDFPLGGGPQALFLETGASRKIATTGALSGRVSPRHAVIAPGALWAW